MYLAPACTCWLALGMLLVEWPAMQQAGALSLMAARPLLYLSAAALGFAVNTLAYFVIQLASSLTLKVLGTVKNAGVIWIGVLALHETVTGIQVREGARVPPEIAERLWASPAQPARALLGMACCTCLAVHRTEADRTSTCSCIGCSCIGWGACTDTVCCMQGFGYAVSLIGFFWYNHVKMQGAQPVLKAHTSYTALPTQAPRRP